MIALPLLTRSNLSNYGSAYLLTSSASSTILDALCINSGNFFNTTSSKADVYLVKDSNMSVPYSPNPPTSTKTNGADAFQSDFNESISP